MGHKPTDEQQAIIDCDVNPEDIVAVTAFAGTGKTACLVMFAEAHPDKKILYLAYNRAMREEADLRFPSNTLCKTTHQICWKSFGAKYQKAGKLGNLRKKQIADIMPREVNIYGHKWENIKAIDQTLKNFMYSEDEHINKAHIPSWVEHPPKGADKTPSLSVSEIINYACYLWEDQQSTLSNTPMTHDGYLKLFQLSKPKLDFDIILFDEVQDANAATLAIVMDQSRHTGIMCVGDPYQQMYAFRGSVNAFELIPATETFSLTSSFRFGEETAALASSLLREKFGEEREIKGIGAPTRILDMRNTDTTTDEALEGAVIIARTNGKLLQKALFAMEAGLTYGFMGGFNKDLYWTIQAIYNLRYGEGLVSHDFIGLFNSFEDLQEYAIEAHEAEILSLIKLLNVNGSIILTKIRELMDNETPFKKAEVKLTTAHKSKGQEYSNIWMAEDFVPQEVVNRLTGEKKVVFSDDEANILYVTMTRGIDKVHISEELAQFMEDFNIL